MVLSLHYNGNNSVLFVNAVKNVSIERKKTIFIVSIAMDNISKDFEIDKMKKTGLKGILHAFTIDCNIIDTNDIIDIHNIS